ncbi:MAG: YbaK/EbsC family protein [Anaerolineae bacterium]|nr:YbaK/EbsC family protein [Anaerolineae bacterium]
MREELRASARKVQEALDALGFGFQVVELPDSTRTAKEAAAAVGCTVGQIAKSLVFQGKVSGRPLLVIASGSNRVDEQRLASLAGEPVTFADADVVRTATGFVIGGVPPTGHIQSLETYIDEDLMAFAEIWAAAGTPFAVFKLHPEDLPHMTGGQVVTIAR